MSESKKAAPEASVDETHPLTAHLEELRKRIIYVFIIVIVVFGFTYWQAEIIMAFVTKPLIEVLPPESTLSMLKLTEGFFTELKLSLVSAVFFAMPLILYHIWKFIAPGLYAHEKRYIVGFVIVASVLFFTGAAFAYYIVFPFGFKFFLAYAGEDALLTANLSVQWYLSFVVRLIMGFGIVFEMPVFTLFLAKMGLVTAAGMRKYRRYSLVGIFIGAAILTPPDVFTQLMMSGPLIILYELSILVAKIFGRKKEFSDDDVYE